MTEVEGRRPDWELLGYSDSGAVTTESSSMVVEILCLDCTESQEPIHGTTPRRATHTHTYVKVSGTAKGSTSDQQHWTNVAFLVVTLDNHAIRCLHWGKLVEGFVGLCYVCNFRGICNSSQINSFKL